MFGDLPVLIMLLISRRSCEQKENNILLCASKVNHFYSLNHFQNRNVKCIQPRLYPNTQNFLRRSCENKNTISTHLWRTWVEVVAEPSSVRGRGFCVVWWNGDGRAVGQLITARRCFPLSRVWRQRRGVSLDKKWSVSITWKINISHFYWVLSFVTSAQKKEKNVHLLMRFEQTVWQNAASLSCRPGCKNGWDCPVPPAQVLDNVLMVCWGLG